MNNSKIHLIEMSSIHAMILNKIELKPFNKAKQAIGQYKEIKLKKSIAIRYLLKSDELKGDYRYRVTDLY